MAAKQVLDLENISFEDDEEDIAILLVGRTGSGKSATGNLILGKDAFESKGGVTSVTDEYRSGSAVINGRKVTVVDTPGLNDTETPNTNQMTKLVVDQITLALIQFPNGFHAAVPVISYNERLPVEVNNTTRIIVKLLGLEAFKSHGVSVISYRDAFERDYPNQDVDTAFGNWLKNLDKKYQWIREDCDGRCVLFNNITTNLEERERQRQTLIDFIDSFKEKKRYIPRTCRWSVATKGARFNSRLKVKKYLRTKNALESVSCILKTSIKNNSTFDEMTIISLKETTETIVAMLSGVNGKKDDLSLFSTCIESLRPNDTDSLARASTICMMINTFQKEIFEGIKCTQHWHELRSRVVKSIPAPKCDMM